MMKIYSEIKPEDMKQDGTTDAEVSPDEVEPADK